MNKEIQKVKELRVYEHGKLQSLYDAFDYIYDKVAKTRKFIKQLDGEIEELEEEEEE